jgi:hypothetical protein
MGENTFIGLQLASASDDDVKLHCTLTFITDATEEQQQRAWQVYTGLLANKLPLPVQIGKAILVGRDNDVDAHKILLAGQLYLQLQEAYRATSVRENNEFPQLLMHVTVDTPEKKAALYRIGKHASANMLYMSTTGADKRVLQSLTGQNSAMDDDE